MVNKLHVHVLGLFMKGARARRVPFPPTENKHISRITVSTVVEVMKDKMGRARLPPYRHHVPNSEA